METFIFSKINYYIRLLIHESLNCRTYSKIFLSLSFNSTMNINSPEELKRHVEDYIGLDKKLIGNKEYKNKLKNIIIELSLEILKKETVYSQFDNIESIIYKIHQI